MPKDAKSAFAGAVFAMILISITVTGLSASLVARDHHDGVAITHLVIVSWSIYSSLLEHLWLAFTIYVLQDIAFHYPLLT